jgi:hypothetical protein
MFALFILSVLGWMVYSSHTPEEWREILKNVEE